MIILGLGSNLHSSFGDRFDNINKALSILETHKIKILLKSSFYETPSYPNIKDPKFINVVIGISTTLKPAELAATLLFIEEKLERKRNYKNEPRTCDIDIIDFNGIVKNFKTNNFELILPHERLTNRNFVLHPLKEICSNWSHPKTKKNINILINNLNETNNEITKLSQSDISKYVK